MVSNTYAENCPVSPDDPRPLRILFISSRGSGGSGTSQRALSEGLQNAGAEVMALVDNTAGYSVTRYLHEQLWDASVRFEKTPVIGGSATWLRSIPGRHPLHTTEDILLSPAPENAFPELAHSFQPDVVVGSSLERPAWRHIRATCHELNVPAVLYLRDKHELSHLQPGNGAHSGVLASTESLTRMANDLGVEAHFVPPIVDVRSARTGSSRERVVLVDPRREHGLEVVDDLARTFPIIEFVLQELSPLPYADRQIIDQILAVHPNVSLRPQPAAPADVYRDAAVILAPHQLDNRPRTILEALSNGIPVVASDLPGMVEAVGPGGLIVPGTSGPAGWRDAIDVVWNNPAVYGDLERKARAFSARADAQPDHIVKTFLQRLGGMITDHEPVLT